MATGRVLGIGAVIAGLAGLGILLFWNSSLSMPTDSRTPEQVVRERAEAFSLQLKHVSLLSPAAGTEITQEYGAYVTPELLAQWQTAPATAPGRQTSSPYPDRLVVQSVTPSGERYVVEGEIILESSAGEAGRERVTLTLENRDGAWLIAEYVQEGNTQNQTPTRLSLQMNERADVPGLGIEVTEVLEDSRCPADVQCIQAGTVRLATILYTDMGDGSAPQEFKLGESITTETREVELVEVRPAPQAGEAIADTEYEFVFEIRPHDPSVI